MDPKPDSTAVRTALWRALHLQVDPPPHVFVDPLGEELVGERDWRSRPDMAPEFSKSMRASIVGRARFIEDLLRERQASGIDQYVILGAGLDTFSFRHPQRLTGLRVFEVDEPRSQAWKRARLGELGWRVPEQLEFVPVDFEAGETWWDKLFVAGFARERPALIVSAAVSMYLTLEATLATLRQVANLARPSTLAMTFLLEPELLPPEERALMQFVMSRAAEGGTPFRSLFSPEAITSLARSAGFRKVEVVSAAELHSRYFADRTDDLNAGTAECFLIASS